MGNGAGEYVAACIAEVFTIEEALSLILNRLTASVKFSSPRIRVISNTTGKPAEEAEIANAAYWQPDVRKVVKFPVAMETLQQLGCEQFIMVGPYPNEASMGDHSLPENARRLLPSLQKGGNDWQPILNTLSELYANGATVDWTGFDQPYLRHKIALPSYPFERERYWMTHDSLTPCSWKSIL